MTDSVDMRSIISEILRNGKIDGFIPMDEIKRVQSDYDLSNEKVEEILQKIRAANIDLIESDEDELIEEETGKNSSETEPKGQSIPVDPTKAYFHEIRQLPTLTKDEMFALAYRMRDGDPRAREKLIEANLRLVINIAIFVLKHKGGATRRPCTIYVSVFRFYFCCFFLLLTAVQTTAPPLTNSSANHDIRLLLSPVGGAFGSFAVTVSALAISLVPSLSL